MRDLKITLAKTAGFCFGVDRAVKLVDDLLKNGERVYTLGPIIHNKQVTDDFEKRGATIVEKPAQADKNGVLVIRTHGVSQEIIDEIENLRISFTDATCPFVKKIHKIVKEASENNDVVLIAGDKNHPEVQGIVGHCNCLNFVFANEEDVENIYNTNPEIRNSHITVVSQTTFSVEKWKKSIKKINLLYTNALIFDTICIATDERQNEAEELSSVSDAMIVIGGRQSSNTAKLRDVCLKNCKRTFLIETAAELKNIDFSGCERVGVTAGASTPACIIKEVLETMSEVNEKNTIVEESAESFEAMLEESLKNLNTDQKVRGTVVGITPSEVQVEIVGRKQTGYVPLSELTLDPTLRTSDVVSVGDEIDLIIMKTNDAEGTIMLSKRLFDAGKAWDQIIKAQEEGTVLEGIVTNVVRGGVIAVANGARVFIPASQATANKNDPLEDLLKKKVQFKIIEVNKQRKRAVGSIRVLLNAERKEAEEAFWAQAKEGQTYTGTVKSLTSYGAFVDIGGVDGMIHISELSWTRIKHPSEVVKVGDTVEVYIKELDSEKKRISLGYKKTEDNPWEILKNDYPEGTVVTAKIVGMTTFGAFAQVIPGVDGLIHISQIANRHIEKPQDVLKVGEEVQAQIIGIDFDKKRVSLSIRELLEPETVEIKDAPETQDAPAENAEQAKAETEETAE